MAEKIVRERAEYEGEVVTIINRGRITSTVRNRFGFIEQVKTKQLAKISGDQSKLTFEES